MFSQALRYIFGEPAPTGRRLTHREMEDLDVGYQEGPTMLDLERVLIENGIMVGTTATIQDRAVTLSPGIPPSRYADTFLK
jgi:hypothetical protein